MTKKKAPEAPKKETTAETREFDACFKVVSSLCDEIAPFVVEKLRLALAPHGEFHVHRSKVGPGSNTLHIFIEDMSPHRLGGTVSFDFRGTMWKDNFKPSTSHHACDHAPHAGWYVLGGVESKSRIQVPALNDNALETLDLLHRAMAFTRVLRDAELYIDTLVTIRVAQLGEAFLKALKDD